MAPQSVQSAVLDNYQAVVSAFSEFLTVAVHTILYERDIYPRTSFLSARKYNYPVRQNRHPKVCQWIMDAVAAVETELLKVCAFHHTPHVPRFVSGTRRRNLKSCCCFQGRVLYDQYVESLDHEATVRRRLICGSGNSALQGGQ